MVAAMTRSFTVFWTDAILDDCTRHLIEDGKATQENMQRMVSDMKELFPYATIPLTDYESLIPVMTNDPGDRHVLAAAVSRLIMALESQAECGEFFLDKNSGEIILISDYTDDDADAKRQQLDEEPDRFLYIQPIASHVGWGIMDDFVQSLKNRDAQEVLERALNGRKSFRSFKDELLRFPDIREQWFAHHTSRMTEIARDWLEDNSIERRAPPR